MSLSKALEAYRHSTALRLRHDQNDRRTVAENLTARLLKIEKESGAAKGPLSRARQPLPAATICPRCWIDRGLQIPLAPVEPDTVGDTSAATLFRCTAPSCRWEIAA